MAQTQTKKAKREPYCSNCGYVLTGLTESSRCPECGKPLVEVLTWPTDLPNFGKRYRSKATLFGLPVIDVALGPKNGEMRGKAKGIIAIGDIATGGVAIGGRAVGVVAIGGLAVGVCGIGGLGVGLLAAIGGGAIGTMAAGGGAAGILANGGGAVGVMAQGGGAIGTFTRDSRGELPADGGAEAFERFAWFFGSWPPNPASQWHPMLAVACVIFLVALVIVLAGWFKLATTEDGMTNVA
jgi:hypothetical protein